MLYFALVWSGQQQYFALVDIKVAGIDCFIDETMSILKMNYLVYG
jgi:hypothetical protein